MAVRAGDILEAVLDANDAWFAQGHARAEAAGAWFVHDERFPDVYDANHARRLRDDEVDPPAFVAALEERYAHCRHRSVRLDPRNRAGALEAQLLLRGYATEQSLLMAREGEPRGRAAAARIAPISSDAEWGHYARLKGGEFAARKVPVSGAHWAAYVRSKCPPIRFFLASLDGVPVGFFSEFTSGRVTCLEDLYVDPAARGRGVATALVAHCEAQGRAQGAVACFLSARADDTPKEMYARMGFRAIGVTRNLLRSG